MTRIAAIYRYPVKGLSPEQLDSVALTPGDVLPGDRGWAIEQGAAQFDPDAPRYFPKVKFLMLMRDEKLAALQTSYDDSTETLTISRGGKVVSKAQLSTPVGRGIAEQFFAAFLGSSLPGKPRVVRAPGHAFTDVPAKWISVINLASVRDIERVAGVPVDPLRFRANIYLEGLEPWAEKAWTEGQDVALGPVQLKVEKHTVRCAATNVNPATAQRDMQIPQLLDSAFGANLCGVYLSVRTAGQVAVGDPMSIA